MIKQPIKRQLMDEFRSSRGQSTEVSKISTPPSRSRRQRTPYDSFLYKYNNLEECIDTFGTRDIVYYFRETAQNSGYKYTIANIQKDMAIAKRLKNQYSIREICGMIEFLYNSDQDYLDKAHLSMNVLASRWVNTIYADMMLWVDDKYIPRSVQDSSKRNHSQHEWSDSAASDETKIGVKL